MRWTTAAIASSILAGCGKVSAPALPPDGGPSQPTVEDVDPAPGAVAAGARLPGRLSPPVDEGQLLPPPGRGETPAPLAGAGAGRAPGPPARAPPPPPPRARLPPPPGGL